MTNLTDTADTAVAKAIKTAKGRLIVCSTPIGNLGDITQRVIQALEQADAVLAEDTRVTRRLLTHLNIHTKLERCDEHVIRERAGQLIARIAAGQVLALVSDAGTPAVSDPGAVLVAAVRAAGLPVEVLPGASAVLTALVASGFAAQSFYFAGFLPRRSQQRQALLIQLAELPAVLIFYESAQRTLATLSAIAAVFPDRQICLARELTKLYEEVLVDSADALQGLIMEREQSKQPLKGEIVLLVEAPAKSTAKIHVDKYERPSC